MVFRTSILYAVKTLLGGSMQPCYVGFQHPSIDVNAEIVETVATVMLAFPFRVDL
jgi:hypothetical protein